MSALEGTTGLVKELQQQLREVRTVYSILQTDKATARHLWKALVAKYPSLASSHAPREDILDESKRPKCLSLDTLRESKDETHTSILDPNSPEADLELLSSHRKTVAERDQFREKRQKELHSTYSSYPSRLLLILEDGKTLSEELRVSISEIDRKIDQVKNEIREMACDQQKFEYAMERFNHQLFGYQFSTEDGDKQHCLTHFDTLVADLQRKNTFEKAALEEKLRLVLDMFDANEFTIMEDQKPKIELFRNSIPDLSGAAKLDRSFLAMHERTFNISQLQQLYKEKENTIKEIRHQMDKATAEFLRVQGRSEKSLQCREDELKKLKENACKAASQERKRAQRSPEETALRRVLSTSRLSRSASPVDRSTSPTASAVGGASPRATFSQALQEEHHHQQQQLLNEESSIRRSLKHIEHEAFRLMTLDKEVHSLEIQKKEVGASPIRTLYSKPRSVPRSEWERSTEELLRIEKRRTDTMVASLRASSVSKFATKNAISPTKKGSASGVRMVQQLQRKKLAKTVETGVMPISDPTTTSLNQTTPTNSDHAHPIVEAELPGESQVSAIPASPNARSGSKSPASTPRLAKSPVVTPQSDAKEAPPPTEDTAEQETETVEGKLTKATEKRKRRLEESSRRSVHHTPTPQILENQSSPPQITEE